MLCNEFINQVETGGIRTHGDALKYDSVRYSSFYRNYPRDSPIPASCLALNGFYFDVAIRSIRCIECGFQTNDLYIEMMTQLLNKHYKHNNNCSKIKDSLSRILECVNDDVLENLSTQQKSLESKASPQNTEPVAVAKSFATDEARLKSFEGVKLQTNVLKLAQNGLYHPKRENTSGTFPLAAKKLSGIQLNRMDTSDQNDADQSSANNVDDDRSLSVESLAKTLPSMILLKCAFCKYECLLHSRSSLNTFFKNPIDEHREKFAGVCSLLAAEENKTKPTVQHKAVDIDLENDFEWLKTMYEFQGLDSEKIKSHVIRPVNSTEVVVESAPKIIFKLYNACRSSHTQASKFPVMRTTSQPEDASGNVSGQGQNQTKPVVYLPNQVGSLLTKSTTSDFSQLQHVLNQSDNVLSRKAHNPAYAQYESRLDSFRDWPATLSQQPSDLAKAGFYYFGIKDMVKCFFCNGGLKNWDSNDDPYMDHVRWFPGCQYIRQLMGPVYVEQVREKYKNMESGFADEEAKLNETQPNYGMGGGSRSSGSGGTTSSSSSSPGSKSHPRSVSPRTLNSRLDTNIIRKIVDYKFINNDKLITLDSIREAIQNKLCSHELSTTTTGGYGDDFKSPVELAFSAYAIDKRKRDKLVYFEDLSDFIVFNLPMKIRQQQVQNYMMVKFGVFPLHVRILHEKEKNNPEHRSFCLVTLQKNDKKNLAAILKDIEKYLNSEIPENERSNTPIVVLRTEWSDIEKKLKPFIDKPIIVEMNTPQALEEEHQNVRRKQTEEFQQMNQKPKSQTEMDIEASKNQSSDAEKSADTSQLIEENERLKNERLCVVCLSKDKNVLFLPCAHLAACLDCSLSLQSCPVCRSKIQATVRTFT